MCNLTVKLLQILTSGYGIGWKTAITCLLISYYLSMVICWFVPISWCKQITVIQDIRPKPVSNPNRVKSYSLLTIFSRPILLRCYVKNVNTIGQRKRMLYVNGFAQYLRLRWVSEGAYIATVYSLWCDWFGVHITPFCSNLWVNSLAPGRFQFNFR